MAPGLLLLCTQSKSLRMLHLVSQHVHALNAQLYDMVDNLQRSDLRLCVCVVLLGSALDKLISSLVDLKARLDSRMKVSPAVFAENMKLREETHHLGTF